MDWPGRLAWTACPPPCVVQSMSAVYHCKAAWQHSGTLQHLRTPNAATTSLPLPGDLLVLALHRLRQCEGKIATLTVINSALQKENEELRRAAAQEPASHSEAELRVRPPAQDPERSLSPNAEVPLAVLRYRALGEVFRSVLPCCPSEGSWTVARVQSRTTVSLGLAGAAGGVHAPPCVRRPHHC